MWFLELYNAYKEGKKTKEDLYDITDQITEAYNLEEAAIAKLNGNYDKLTESIKKQWEEDIIIKNIFFLSGKTFISNFKFIKAIFPFFNFRKFI